METLENFASSRDLKVEKIADISRLIGKLKRTWQEERRKERGHYKKKLSRWKREFARKKRKKIKKLVLLAIRRSSIDRVYDSLACVGRSLARRAKPFGKAKLRL